MVIITMLFVFFLLLALGQPIIFAMGIGVLAGFLVLDQIPLLVLPQRLFVGIDSFSLMAIPLYILAGEIMLHGGMTDRLVAFAKALVGHIRGGLAQVNNLANILFAGISGSAQADCAAIGSLMIPTMTKNGYDKDFSVSLTATASMIGVLIPPSVLMIIYGSMTGLSITALFLAGVVPGLLVGLSLMILIHIYSVKRGYKSEQKASLKKIGETLLKAMPSLFMPVIIIFGIFSGVFTVTEAGVVAVVYAIILGFVTKSLNFSLMKKILVNAAIVSSITMLLVSFSTAYGWLLIHQRFPNIIADLLLSITTNPMVVYFLINLIVLFLGLFLEALSGLVILVPVFAPIADLMGFDPIHFALVMIFNLLLGSLTPPVGSLFFIAASIGKITMSECWRTIWVFVGVMIIVLFLMTYVPPLVTFLPNLVIN